MTEYKDYNICRCIDDHPHSLLFITVIPIDYKIINFSLYVLVCFFNK